MDYKKFKIQRLDPISPTFCSAKWLESYIWIHTGVTSSCNYPAPHKIDLDQVAQDIRRLHNTPEKIRQRKMMLDGEQPEPCSNCWQLENKTPGVLSDRILKSSRLEQHDFNQLDLSTDVVPSLVEIVFDTLCNFTCTYCDASQSSSWAADLIKQGPYKDIRTDEKKTYVSLRRQDLLSEDQQEQLSQYIMDWFRSHINQVDTISVIGGEPLLSPRFWRFLEFLNTLDSQHLTLKINTNLCPPDSKLDQFLTMTQRFKKLSINVSIDGTGPRAEFIRAGLDWNQFSNNLQKIINKEGVDVILVNTVNVLSMDSMIDFLNWYLTIKQQDSRVRWLASIVRWPAFQSVVIMPDSLKKIYIDQLITWKTINLSMLTARDIDMVDRLLSLLTSVDYIYNNQSVEMLTADLKTFLSQFSRRRRLDCAVFSKEFNEWIAGYPVRH